MNELVIAGVTIIQDEHGRYNVIAPTFHNPRTKVSIETLLNSEAMENTPGFFRILETMAALPKRPATPMTHKTLYILFSPQGRLIKIGIAINVQRRLSTLERGHGFPLTLLYQATSPDAKLQETSLLLYWNSYRQQGEWFELPANMTPQKFVMQSVNYLKRNQAGLSLVPAPSPRDESKEVHYD